MLEGKYIGVVFPRLSSVGRLRLYFFRNTPVARGPLCRPLPHRSRNKSGARAQLDSARCHRYIPGRIAAWQSHRVGCRSGLHASLACPRSGPVLVGAVHHSWIICAIPRSEKETSLCKFYKYAVIEARDGCSYFPNLCSNLKTSRSAFLCVCCRHEKRPSFRPHQRAANCSLVRCSLEL